MKLFRASGFETQHRIFTDASERIKEQGIDFVVRAAAAAIPKELGTTTFAWPSISCCRTGG